MQCAMGVGLALLPGKPVTFGNKEEVTWVWGAGGSQVSEFKLDVPTNLSRLELKGKWCVYMEGWCM